MKSQPSGRRAASHDCAVSRTRTCRYQRHSCLSSRTQPSRRAERFARDLCRRRLDRNATASQIANAEAWNPVQADYALSLQNLLSRYRRCRCGPPCSTHVAATVGLVLHLSMLGGERIQRQALSAAESKYSSRRVMRPSFTWQTMQAVSETSLPLASLPLSRCCSAKPPSKTSRRCSV